MTDRSLRVTVSVASLASVAVSGLARAEGAAGSAAPAVATATPPGTATAVVERRSLSSDPVHPPPLHIEYAQYGAAILALVDVDSGAMCGSGVRSPLSGRAPCILGSGAGVAIRIGYRSPGPWYVGGAYAFAKMDSSNLFRLGIFQQLWAEVRYLPDTGYRLTPYATWGVGGVTYGNEWGVETGGAMLSAGTGFQFDVSRVAVIGVGVSYRPTLIVGWTDTAGYMRPTGVAHFIGFDIQLEVRSQTGRR